MNNDTFKLFVIHESASAARVQGDITTNFKFCFPALPFFHDFDLLLVVEIVYCPKLKRLKNMPLQLFSNKFQHPKPTPRKKLNFHSTENKTAEKKGEKDTIIIKLGENSAEFMKGEWMSLPTNLSKGIHQDFSDLQEQAQQLKEENNLLTMKVEVLLDMLTQATAMCNKRKKVIRELQMFITSKMGITDVLYKESDSEQTSEDSSEAEEDKKLTDEEKTEEEEEDECSDSTVNKYQLQKVTSAQTVC